MDDGLLEIFRTESLERVDRMVATLVAAEADGGDAAAIAELFREAHSLKGSAGMFGLDQVGALAGTMEDVLARARERGVLSPRAIPALLNGVDAIRAAVTDDPTGVDPAAAALRALDDGATPAAAPATAQRAAAGQTLRVSADTVDRLLAGVGGTARHSRRLERLVAPDGVADEALREELERGQTLVGDLKDDVLDLRTSPLSTAVGRLPRAVRDAAAEVGRDVRLELTGMETPLDRSILDGVSDALVHLLRNAVSHGIEPPDEREALGKPRTGTISVRAAPRGGMVALTCTDDGRGVAREQLVRAGPDGALADLLAQPGFSTSSAVSDLAGRGVGLDAVKRYVEGLGGVLEVSSEPGVGTEVTLLVPLTLAVVTVLLVERGEQVFGLPLSSIERALRDVRGQQLHGHRTVELDGASVPLVDLADSLGMAALALRSDGPVVLVASGARRAAVACDRLLGDRELVVKTLGPLLAGVAGYLGAAVLDDGDIALLLDPAHLVRTAAGATPVQRTPGTDAPRLAPKILVVDDQFIVRELARTILDAAGYRVSIAQDGVSALAVLDEQADVACVVSDVEMPGMGGLALLEAIRARPSQSSLPVVFVTSREDDETRARGARAGVDAWIVKSQFDHHALLETVERLLGAR